ncbi:MAG TPA: M28 family peptidase [Vicinamibacterales bacterium]|nr:M28 family peptidase [Vicinamibacterales bacterium]
MTSILAVVVLLVSGACASAQTPAAVPPRAAFDGARAFEDLKKIVAIGPRPSGSEGARATRDYIKQQLYAIGLQPSEQAFDATTRAGIVRMVNVRAKLPGRGTGRLIIAGHYDTKRFTEFPFVGANDGGSSTAFLLELARALKGRINAVPIEILFLDGEEAIGEWETGNTFGSRHYVEAAVKAGTIKQIKAMVLVDMIGDSGLVIKRESHSTPWLTDAIWSAAKTLNRPEFVDESTPIEDDHLPFLAAGVPAVNIIDLEYPDVSMRYWHTADDTLDKTSARSLQVVGEVLLAALPAIELRIR